MEHSSTVGNGKLGRFAVLWSAVLYCTALCITTLCFGADWSEEKVEDKPDAIWTEIDVKWNKEPGEPYDEAKVDQPTEGYYFTPENFVVPDSWPSWAARRFDTLGKPDLSEADKKVIRTWSRPPLKADRRWVGVAGSKVIDAVEIKAPLTASHFVFYRLDPPDGTIEQDFRGNARVFNLKGRKRYWIHAFSSTQYLGKVDIDCEIVPVWIKVVKDFGGSNDPKYYFYKHIKDGFEDLDGNFWLVGNHSISGDHPDYYHSWLYKLDARGNLIWDEQIPRYKYYSDGNTVYSALQMFGEILPELDSDTFVVTCGDSLLEYNMNTGATNWQNDGIFASSVVDGVGGGYVVLGHTEYTSDPDDAWPDSHQLYRVAENGTDQNWGSTGDRDIDFDGLMPMKVIALSDDDYAVMGYAVGGVGGDLTDTAGGNSDKNGEDPAWEGDYDADNAFDENVATLWRYTPNDGGGPRWVGWDFGAGNAQVVTAINGRDDAGKCVHWNNANPRIPRCTSDMLIQGSNNRVAWTTLHTLAAASEGYTGTIEFANTTAYRYYRWYMSACDNDYSFYAYELSLHSEGEGAAVIWKLEGAAGANEGDELWEGEYTSEVSQIWAGCESGGFIFAAGPNINGTVSLIKVDPDSGTTEWAKDYDSLHVVYSCEPIERDGGILLVGDRVIDGTAREAGIDYDVLSIGIALRLDKDGVPKWEREFQRQPLGEGSASYTGLSIGFELEEEGFFFGGGWNPVQNTDGYETYAIRANSKGYSCSDGPPCN